MTLHNPGSRCPAAVAAPRAVALPAPALAVGPRKAAALRIAGHGFFALGAVGLALPLLPTTCFWLLAAACWTHGAPELRERLLGHRCYGAPLRAWLEDGVISRAGKYWAIGGMCAGAGTSVVATGLGATGATVVAAVVAPVAVYLATRPERRAD